jgi:peptidoglycan/LPS O-acetylase OafA/YrhL
MESEKTTTVAAIQTRDRTHFDQLDGVRFLAVGLVLFEHWMIGHNNVPTGALGVVIFFVLSGFLISRILLVSRDRTEHLPDAATRYFKPFYIRRTLRIFPAYYLTLLLLFIFNVEPVREQIGWLATYTPNIYMALHGTWMGIVDHFWSLAVEEQFYIFFPLFLFIIPKKWLPAVLVALMLCSVGLRILAWRAHLVWSVAYVSMPTCLDSFGLGALMAYLYQYRRPVFEQLFRPVWGLLAALLLYAFMYYYANYISTPHNGFNDIFDRLVESFVGFFLVGKAVLGFSGPMRWLLTNPVSAYLGQISYGIYLYHNIVFHYYHTPPTFITIRIWNRLVREMPLLGDWYGLRLLYFLGLTIGVAMLSWHLLENPINKLKDKLS